MFPAVGPPERSAATHTCPISPPGLGVPPVIVSPPRTIWVPDQDGVWPACWALAEETSMCGVGYAVPDSRVPTTSTLPSGATSTVPHLGLGDITYGPS